MALIVPSGPRWAYSSHNLTSTPSLPLGTTVSAGVNNVDSMAVPLLPALTHDVEYLRIGYAGFNQSNADTSTLLDILIDPAGGSNWLNFIDDLLVGYSTAPALGGSAPGPCFWYDFPLWIPAGASLGVRARTAWSTTINGSAFVFAHGGSASPASWWCGQRVQTLGTSPATSKGTGVMPGALNWGAWTNIGASLDAAAGAVQFGVQGPQGQGGGSYVNLDYWQFGVDGAVIGPTIVKGHTTAEMGWSTPTGPLWASLPVGAQFQARAMTDARSTPVTIDVAIYAVQ